MIRGGVFAPLCRLPPFEFLKPGSMRDSTPVTFENSTWRETRTVDDEGIKHLEKFSDGEISLFTYLILPHGDRSTVASLDRKWTAGSTS